MSSHLKIGAGDRFPIGLWWPPPPEETTPRRYREMRDAGFTFVVGGNGALERFANRRMLRVAADEGVDGIVSDARLRTVVYPRDLTADDHRQVCEVIVGDMLDDYRSFDNFAGFLLFDEPIVPQFPVLGRVTEVLRKMAPEQLGLINLFPSYTFMPRLRARSYRDYVRRFVDEVEPPVLSFLHYPLLKGHEGPLMTADYFYNWEVIRKAAAYKGVPSWTFIQSVDYASRRLPSEAEMLWQINVNLAYGARGVMYFTYWTPQSAEGFTTALITPCGERTPLYDYAKGINAYLSAMGNTLRTMRSVSVVHKASPLPRFTTPFSPDGWIDGVTGSSVIVAQFDQDTPEKMPNGLNGMLDDRRWYFIVNHSHENAADTSFTFNEHVQAAAVYDVDRGGWVPVPLDRSRGRRFRIRPGGAELIRVTK